MTVLEKQETTIQNFVSLENALVIVGGENLVSIEMHSPKVF